MNNPDALWKDLLLYRLNLMLHSNQALAFFRRTQILSRHKKLHKQNNEFFFKHLINAWLHFTNNRFPLPKEILNQPIFSKNSQTKLKFSSSNPNFCDLPLKTITVNCTTIRDLCRLFQLVYFYLHCHNLYA